MCLFPAKLDDCAVGGYWIAMHRVFNRSGVRLFSVSLLPLLVTGCFVVTPEHRHRSHSRGVNLSDAMHAAATGNQPPLNTGESRRIHSSFSPVESGGASVMATTSGTAASDARSGESVEGVVISLSGEQLIPFENYIRGSSRVALNLGLEEEFYYLGLSAGVGDVQFRSGTLPDLATEDSWTFDLGLVGRVYFTEPHTFISPYLTAGIYGQALRWEYRTPVITGGDVISSDAVAGGGGFIGAGLTMERGEFFSVFGEVRVGQTWFESETAEGFRNNVFDDHGYYSFALGLSFKF